MTTEKINVDFRSHRWKYEEKTQKQINDHHLIILEFDSVGWDRVDVALMYSVEELKWVDFVGESDERSNNDWHEWFSDTGDICSVGVVGNDMDSVRPNCFLLRSSWVNFRLIFAFFGWLIMSILEWVFRFVDVVDIGCVSIHDVYSRILCV